jgi:hypothetical protein
MPCPAYRVSAIGYCSGYRLLKWEQCMIEVQQAVSAVQLDAVRTLMRSFVEWSRQRYANYLTQVNAYFDAGAYEAELAGLPGKYAPPQGSLLLSTVDGQSAGCVAFRPFDERTCEMGPCHTIDRRGQGGWL